MIKKELIENYGQIEKYLTGRREDWEKLKKKIVLQIEGERYKLLENGGALYIVPIK
jgi:hypothetical protein